MPFSPLKKRRPRFVVALTSIIRDPRISPGAKTVLLIIKSYAGKDTIAFPSIDTIAKGAGLDRKTVFRYIKELESLRILSRAKRFKDAKQTSNGYTLDDEHFARHLAKKHGQTGVAKTERGRGTKTGHEVDVFKKTNIIPFQQLKQG